jgi:hypothetical protein
MNIQPFAKVAVKYVTELHLYDVQTKTIKILFIAMTSCFAQCRWMSLTAESMLLQIRLYEWVRTLHEHAVILTFKNLSPIYIGRAYRYPTNVAFYIKKNISTEYFKHVAHSPFFSPKCRLFHNATFFVPVLFTFYIQCLLKFKCKI